MTPLPGSGESGVGKRPLPPVSASFSSYRCFVVHLYVTSAWRWKVFLGGGAKIVQGTLQTVWLLSSEDHYPYFL